MKKYMAVLLSGFLAICGLLAYQSIRTLKSELRASQKAVIVLETSEAFLRDQNIDKDERYGQAQDIIGYMTDLAVELDSIFIAWQNMTLAYDKFARAECLTWDGYQVGNLYDSYEYGRLIEQSKTINQRYLSAQANVGAFLEELESIKQPDEESEI